MIETIEARPEHLAEIVDLIEQCIVALEARGIFQWDECYPDEEFFSSAIGRREAYVL